MSITVDGKIVELINTDNNIVELASRLKIALPAPCYRAKERKWCCSACVVEIDGKQQYACCTTPKDGMNIIVTRADLFEIRKERLLNYKKGIKPENNCECDCSSSSECCC